MEWHDSIEEDADDGVSGRKGRPRAAAAKNESPYACDAENPARENVEIIRVLAERPEGENGGDAAGEEEWVAGGHAIWFSPSMALSISMRRHLCR